MKLSSTNLARCSFSWLCFLLQIHQAVNFWISGKLGCWKLKFQIWLKISINVPDYIRLCGYDTHESDKDTHERDLYIYSVIATRIVI
jgi:hypothetical protein